MGQDVDIDALKVVASQSLRYDSNLFRRSADQQSETLSTTTAGVEFDKRYSLQRVELDLSFNHHRYRSNSYLDFDAVNYRAAWHWSLTPRLHGLLSRTRSEDINTFDYYRSFDRNLRTDLTTTGNFEYEVGRDWSLLGGMTQDERSNERPTAQQGDYSLRSASVGGRRSFPSGSSVSYRYIDGRGDYKNRIPGVSASPTAFDQTVHELRARWPVSAKTTLTATIAHVQREHPGYAVRNFSGTRGNIGLLWNATGKTGIQVTLARDISSYQTDTASFVTSNRLALYPYWSLGPRTVLYGGYDLSRQSFGGALPGTTDDNREDRTATATLGMRWNPIEALSLTATLGHERRTSNLDGYGYRNRSARMDARFAF
ncbi:hypothetical protein ASF45_03040 [Pseudorhodoferax sp. Leaf265]|nr:hypothetical protein ASF45_03040 [Pseudorhodoferax sp. Leaf265]